MLTTAAKVRAEGNLPALIPDSLLSPHIASAEIELRRALGADTYSAISAETTTTRRAECEKAESCLTLAYALYAMNMETSGTGIVRSKGWDASRSELLTNDEVEKLSEYYRRRAMDLVSPYIPTESSYSELEFIAI